MPCEEFALLSVGDGGVSGGARARFRGERAGGALLFPGVVGFVIAVPDALRSPQPAAPCESAEGVETLCTAQRSLSLRHPCVPRLR